MGVTGFILTVIAGMLGALLRSEIEAWAPPLARRLIGLAVRMSPPEMRDRLREEWSAYVEQVPGYVGKVIAATGFVRAARAIPGVSGELAPKSQLRKRMFDLVVAVPGALFLLPLFLFVASFIRLDSRGPALFRQVRMGSAGRPFYVYKFRSMTIELAEESDHHAGDARITRVGRFIRWTYIDELPQLLNVIKGDMTLVGPRPRSLPEVAGKTQIHKPGLTGMNQDEEASYASQWSLRREFAALIRKIVRPERR